tara:strand:- start:549 stop:878 length:330 start_codon:yes stop_codon:yes gene_type:complete
MKCPECNSKKTRVSSTDPHPLEDFTKRYCKCLDCRACFTTIEKYANTAHNPGRKKNSFSLNQYQCQMIKRNKYMLSNKEWAAIYNVSLSTIIKGKNRPASFQTMQRVYF